jgi:hypothetical protein
VRQPLPIQIGSRNRTWSDLTAGQYRLYIADWTPSVNTGSGIHLLLRDNNTQLLSIQSVNRFTAGGTSVFSTVTTSDTVRLGELSGASNRLSVVLDFIIFSNGPAHFYGISTSNQGRFQFINAFYSGSTPVNRVVVTRLPDTNLQAGTGSSHLFKIV